ncbi:MAG TPA: hypothetical protein VG389_15100, partial [Myxococcota bacterium]|nr:hypothetical protein [Myxococcota bacterium]
LVHAAAAGAGRALLLEAAPLFDGLFELDLPDGEDPTGGLAASLVGLRERLRLRPVVGRVLHTMGMEVVPLNTSPPAVAIGGGVVHLDPREREFLLARALEQIHSGTNLIARMAPGEAKEFLLYICRALAPGTTVVDDAGLGEGVGAQVEAMVGLASPEQLERLEGAVEEFLDVADDFEPESWQGGMIHTANRVALAACGDLAAGLRALARIEGWARGDPLATELGRCELLADAEPLRELVRWATGGAPLLVESGEPIVSD